MDSPRTLTKRARLPASLSSLCSVGLLQFFLLLGCDRTPERPEPPKAAAAPKKENAPSPEATTLGTPPKAPPRAELERYPTAERLVAIGDLHGDLAATRDVLKLAGAIDAADRWVGGKLVVVQTGDQIDRGDEDREILDLLETLSAQAQTASGALHVLNGNHETMNAAGDFRYVTSRSFTSFEGADSRHLPAALLKELPSESHARATAFLPGGTYAKKLAQRPVVIIVGDSLFVHGGVLPSHVDYGLDRLNREVSAWLEGREAMPELIAANDGPSWTRLYSEPVPTAAACKTLSETLTRLALRRMVVGHTVQPNGISAACDEQVFRIDVGMSRHYGGDAVQALEIIGAKTRILSAKKSEAARLPEAAE